MAVKSLTKKEKRFGGLRPSDVAKSYALRRDILRPHVALALQEYGPYLSGAQARLISAYLNVDNRPPQCLLGPVSDHLKFALTNAYPLKKEEGG